MDRLGVRVRLAWAFHAREVRLQVDRGGGFEPLFPETFSFHPERHEPAELQLQLEDLWSDPRRLSPRATRRDAEELVRRLLAALPAHVEAVLDLMDDRARLQPQTRLHLLGDGLLLVRIVRRFVNEKRLAGDGFLQLPALHLEKLVWRISWELVVLRMGADTAAARLADPATRLPDARRISDTVLSRALAAPATAALDDLLLAIAGAAFHGWVESVCLEEDNQAFEREESPFQAREAEILRAVSLRPDAAIERSRDLSPFVRRPGNRDCARVLRKLEVWLLRQYDVPRAAAVIRHAAELARGRDTGDRVLSRHSTAGYLAAIGAMSAPFLGATVAYESAPLLFDVLCSGEVAVILAMMLWFLLVRFAWSKDLTVFRAAVPRIGAGIIVGYLPVFLIDEVWDLARRPWFPLGVVMLLLAFTTLLYLYLEVLRRLGDPRVAFVRARRIFLLGVVQAMALGLVVTSLLGPFMVVRTWEGGGAEASLDWVRAATPPVVGELPRILGIEPFAAFPTAVLLMTFLSFFIGTFLQLLWEDLPITEPL